MRRSVTLLLAGVCLHAVAAQAAGTTLTETGSTLMLPLLKSWAEGYEKTDGGAHLATAGTGSGAGIDAAVDGSAQIGASDAYMSDVQVMQHPGVLNIPLAISAQLVAYNLPGVAAPLKLSGPVLADIYTGRVTAWNDPEIAALNPGAGLPATPITAVHRSDSSGDTFIFTQFLTFSTASWEAGPGYGTDITWPGKAPATAAGNDGMVQAIAKTPGAIGYVGGSYAAAMADAKLGTATLQNEAGKFVTATPDSVTAAAAALTPRTPADERLTLAFAPGEASYPLINYEYAMVRMQQPQPGQADALRHFLSWAVTPGQGTAPAYLDPVHFIALPPAIRAMSELQIAKLR